jgi:hypothetical protein
MNSKTNLPIECYKNELDISDDYNPEDQKRSSLLKKYKEKNQSALEKDYARSNLMYDTLKKHFGDEMTYKKYFMFYLELDIFLLQMYLSSFEKQ